jgi:hypothetical protein
MLWLHVQIVQWYHLLQNLEGITLVPLEVELNIEGQEVGSIIGLGYTNKPLPFSISTIWLASFWTT